MRIEVGDKVKIPVDRKFHPEADHFGICVWISEDRKTVAMRCNRSHNGKKNVIFLVKIDSKK